MAKSEALAVLHGTLDFRRSIDVPGYERIDLHPATRFIATMNYGYAGTKELNEALVSRFVVIWMPMISQEHLILLLQDYYPTLKTEGAKELAAVYLDLQKKCENAQISSRAMDLRGLLDGVALMEKGLNVQDALDMGITNKTFDPYEQTLIQDTIRGRISKKMKPEDLFEEKCGSCRKELFETLYHNKRTVQRHGTAGDAGRTESEKFCLDSGGTVWAGTAVSRLCTGWDGGYVSEYYYRSQL